MKYAPDHPAEEPADPPPDRTRSFEPPPGSPPLDAALRYAAEDHPVFPLHGVRADGSCTCGREACSSPGKHPAVENGHRDATLDPEQIRTWWTEHDNWNIGLRCDGLVVLDLDTEAGQESHFGLALLEHYGDLPYTRGQRTGTGAHLIYRLPEGVEIGNSTANLLASGVDAVDVRGGDRGYIVAAPSRHANGKPYQMDNEPIAEAPKWLCELLLAPAPTAPPASSSPVTASGDSGSAYGLTALAGHVEDVSRAAPGTRNNILNTASYKLGQLVAGGELNEEDAVRALAEAASSTGLPEREIRQTIASGLRAGKANPRSAPPASTDASVPGHRFPGVTLEQILAEERTPTPWLINGLIQPSTVGTLAGPRNTLKSFFALETAFSVAAGWPLLDHFEVVEPGPVSYWWEDDSRENMRSRIQRITDTHGKRDLPFVFHLNEGLRLPRDIEQLRETILREAAKLLVFDSLYNFLQEGIDMRGEDVLPVVNALKQLADETGAAILIVDHTAKPTEGSRPRGAYGSAFKEAAYRWGIISEQAGELVALTSFANNGPQLLHKQHIALDPDTLLLRPVDPPSGTLDDEDYEQRVYDYIDEHPAGVARNDVTENVHGKATNLRAALNRLLEEGRVLEYPATALGRDGSAHICFTDQNRPSVPEELP